MTVTQSPFSFRQVDKNDYLLVHDWLHKPHVSEFYYGEGLKNTLKNLALSTQGKNNNGRYTFYHWIGFYEGMPFAFLMTSPITGPYEESDPYNKWFKEGERIITLDLLIGEETYLGKKLSHQMIEAFIDEHYRDHTKILIDPAENNPKAIHVYEKAGFIKQARFMPDFDPTTPHWMMVKFR